jgi:hypothetical protein
MNFRDKHNAKLQEGHRVHVPHKHDLGVIDPREQFANAPPYEPGLLPEVYENYVQNNIAEYGGDPAAYACAFIAVHVGVLHSTVEMQTRPSMDNWKNPNDHSLTLGHSGSNKSGMFKDLTKHQEAWQEALDKGTQNKRRTGPKPIRIYTQGGSVEGVLRRISDNRGERLTIGNDEAMSFYMGTGAHHQGAGASLMTDAVCRMYDGRSYSKDLVNEKNSFHIAKCLGTMIMATVFEKFSGWDGFKVMVSSGAMSRTTVGMVSNVTARDARMLIPGASAAMETQLLKLRGLRHVRFALEPDAHDAWSEYIDQREQRNNDMAFFRENEGLLYWCRKYDTRIMSMATVLQAIDFTRTEATMMNYEPFEVAQSEADKIGGGEPEIGKRVLITYENLERAINFVEGFLFQTQEHFYAIASGVTEFGPELMNWVAHRVTTHSADTPDDNVLKRTDLVHRGPACVRPGKGGATDEWRLKADRWVRTLIDCGYIEPFQPDNGRNMNRWKADEQQANYRLRAEFFQKFADEASRIQFRSHDAALQRRISDNVGKRQLTLGKKKAPEQGLNAEVVPADQGGES